MTAVWRVRDRSTFRDLRRRGRRVQHGPLTVRWVPADAGPPRVAYAIGRPVGGAVERNRLRRRLRALVAEHADTLRPGAYLIIASPTAATLDHGDLRRTLRTALDELSG